MSLVKYVYGQTSENLYSVRIHVARRRMSNSLALFNSATQEEIMQTAHNKSQCVLNKGQISRRRPVCQFFSL